MVQEVPRMTKVLKGTVWEASGTTCKVKIDNNDLNVSPDIVIPLELQPVIQPGIEVAFILFDDATGVIINRMDGA